MTDQSVNQRESRSSFTTSALRAVRDGDRDAWDRLVNVYGRLVYWWCRRVDDADEREDIWQEVFVAVYKHRGQFHNYEDNGFRRWLRTITNSKIADYYRAKKRRSEATGGSSGQRKIVNLPVAADDPGSAAEEVKKLYRAIIAQVRSDFSARDWQAFSGVVIEGQQAADVAERLEISRNQVYLAKSRILRRIREDFDDGESLP